MGRTDIVVTGTNAVYTPSYLVPDSQLQATLEQVTERIRLTYAAALKEYIIPHIDGELQASLETVADRIIMNYASGNRHFDLAFPKELVNDQTVPSLTEPVTVFVESTDTVSLTWTAGEFITSSLAYGTSSGTYNESIAVSDYMTETVVLIRNLMPGVTYYGRITMVDISGNQGQSTEFAFATVKPPTPTFTKTPTPTPTVSPTAPPTPSTPLILIYAVLDNNLGNNSDDWQRLVHNVGAHTTASTFVCWLMVPKRATATSTTFVLMLMRPVLRQSIQPVMDTILRGRTSGESAKIRLIPFRFTSL